MYTKTTLAFIVTAVITAAAITGCSTLIDAVGDAVAGALISDSEVSSPEPEGKQVPTPEASEEKASNSEWDFEMELQAQTIFSLAFTGGGFWLTDAEYKEGEFTIFEWIIENEDSVNMEKAFLKKTADGGEWWRIAWTSDDESVVYEALISAGKDGIDRLRARDSEGRIDEVNLSGQMIYSPPYRLEDEEIVAMSKGNDRIDTPAGRFQAKHVAFNFGNGAGKIEWWVTEKVPGSVVKYQFVDSSGALAWSVSLVEYGKKSETILGSF